MTLLVALAGPSRSGKGTCAAVFAQRCLDLGLTCLERQMSDNGKWSLARIFQPTIGRVEAVAWFEELKKTPYPTSVFMVSLDRGFVMGSIHGKVPLQKFLQHGLQEGGRDIFGEHLWTDRIIPLQVLEERWWSMTSSAQRWRDAEIEPYPQAWLDGFFDEEAGVGPTDLALISDLRQPNEARRVKDLGGIVIECVRPTVADAYRTGPDHVTELRLPSELVDMQIANSGDVDELREMAAIVFKNHVWPTLKNVADPTKIRSDV